MLGEFLACSPYLTYVVINSKARWVVHVEDYEINKKYY
jgi:hypothetical protein